MIKAKKIKDMTDAIVTQIGGGQPGSASNLNNIFSLVFGGKQASSSVINLDNVDPS